MITKTEEIMATAFNDDGDLSWEEMNNARKELLRRLEQGEKAEKELEQLKAKINCRIPPKAYNADCYEDNY